MNQIAQVTAAVPGHPRQGTLPPGGNAVRKATSVGATEPVWVRLTLIAAALGFMLLFLVLPLAAVFTEALRKGSGRLPGGAHRTRRLDRH